MSKKEKHPAPEKKAGKKESRTAKLQAEIERLSEEAAVLKDELLRNRAEVENARKRFEKQKNDAVRYASLPLIKELLTVIDNLSLALQYAEKDDPLREGVQMALDGLKKALKHHHLEEIKAVGEKFDPALHEAVSVAGDPSVGDNVIVEEYKTGYRLYGRVVRASSVVVNHQPHEPETKDEEKPTVEAET